MNFGLDVANSTVAHHGHLRGRVRVEPLVRLLAIELGTVQRKCEERGADLKLPTFRQRKVP